MTTATTDQPQDQTGSDHALPVRILLVGVMVFAGVIAGLRWTWPDSISGAVEAMPTYRININAADQASAQLLPGIGRQTAQYIVAYREANGPFRHVNDLDQVRNIGSTTLRRIEPYVVFDAPVGQVR